MGGREGGREREQRGGGGGVKGGRGERQTISTTFIGKSRPEEEVCRQIPAIIFLAKVRAEVCVQQWEKGGEVCRVLQEKI